MAIVYNFNKKLDNHIIDVSQVTAYELYYLSDKSNEKVGSGILGIDTPFTLATLKDGNYKLVLSVAGQLDAIIIFDVFKYLQDSIIREAKTIICGDKGDCGCNDTTANCLSKAGKQCLTHKSIFVKLLSFQNLAIPTYSGDYANKFVTFLTSGVQSYQCKIQTTINNILKEECITGTVRDVETLFKTYVALYWAGMYFIEKSVAGVDAAQLDFIKTKFKYNEMLGCLCNSCINIETLESLFNAQILATKIYSFQFNSLTDNITDSALVTDVYLTSEGTLQNEANMLAGKTIDYPYIGRVGFAIKNNLNGYKFLDTFGNDITNAVFDRVYDEVRELEIFISKDYFVPSTIFYKFLKI